MSLFGVAAGISVAQRPKKSAERYRPLETMIVASGNVDDGSRYESAQRARQQSRNCRRLRFQAAPDSFFPILVFNNELRGAEPGSIGLVPVNSAPLPAALNASFNQLVVEKIAVG